MLWISILFATVCGALAVLVAHLVVGNPKERRVPYLIVIVVVFFGLKLFSTVTLEPRVQIWEANRELRGLPFYRELSEDNPATYAKVEAVVAESVKNGDSQDALAGKIAPIVSAAVPRYAGKASDDAIVSFVQNITHALDALHKSDPEACYAFLFPADGGKVGAPANMSDEDQRKLLAAMGEVIHTAVHSPQPLPNTENAQLLLTPIQAGLLKEFGDDLQLAQRKPSNARERERVCAIIDSLYSKIIALPKSDASTVLRTMLGGQ